ncbi:MAG: hypothetical protein HUK09_05785 [Bacteroidaceae bacterium]|nr:hypothetical protein [Bacteroidaceae bacterium]
MIASEATMHSIQRALRKSLAKLPTMSDDPILTDLHLQVKQESGELLIFDDDDNELTRCIVEAWIGNTDEAFYSQIQPILQQAIAEVHDALEAVNLLRPFSLVLIDEERESVADLYLVDDETVIVSHELMAGLSDELDAFWHELEKQ